MNASRILKVSVAQIHSELGDVSANLTKHLEFIQQARSDHCHLLLFPELSLTGYQLGRSVPQIAMKRDDARLQVLAQEAPAVCVVVGFVEEASPGEYYNAMAWLHHGDVVAVHRKLNLPTYGGLEEGKLYSKGKSLTFTDVSPGWRASSLICADLWNPALVHCAMLQRPELLLAPINSASHVVSSEFSNERNWRTNLNFYAMTYGMPVLMANRFGPEKGIHFWGGSCILGPRGETLAQVEEGESLIEAELTLNEIANARFDLPTIRDADTPLIMNLMRTLI